MKTRLISCTALMCVAAWLPGAPADARVYLGRVDATLTQPAPESQIELTQAFVVLVPIQQFANIGTTHECAFFLNHGPKEARRIRVRWTYTALTGNDVGTAVGYDTKDINGKFSPNATIEAWPEYGGGASQECQKMDGNIRDKQLIYMKTNLPVSLQVRVESVEYADGTSWQASTEAAPSPSP